MKVGVATTLNGNLIVAVCSFANNRYDGYRLVEQLEQSETPFQDTDITFTTVHTDLGYRSLDAYIPVMA